MSKLHIVERGSHRMGVFSSLEVAIQAVKGDWRNDERHLKIKRHSGYVGIDSREGIYYHITECEIDEVHY